MFASLCEFIKEQIPLGRLSVCVSVLICLSSGARYDWMLGA